jgi:hypothetical protein
VAGWARLAHADKRAQGVNAQIIKDVTFLHVVFNDSADALLAPWYAGSLG